MKTAPAIKGRVAEFADVRRLVVIGRLQVHHVDEAGVLEAVAAMMLLLIGFVLGFYVCLGFTGLLVLAARDTPQ